ncbi:MAG: DUF455 family protein [Acidobacteriota bacterium]
MSELRRFAHGVVTSRDLEAKLRLADRRLDDDEPGPALRLEAPGRPANLEIRPGREVKIPRIEGMGDPAQRVRILHALANHELQAAELFAWALLAFPEAPREFRAGLAEILDDEQRHTRMYMARLKGHGRAFGDFPVTGYFWRKTPHLTSPLHFVSAMSLTFENANLDFTVEYAAAARRAGDEKTALVIERVERDEVDHVRFGWRWLQELKEENSSAWETWKDHLAWPLRPSRARGERFYPRGRRAAGLDEDFIARLESAHRDEGV